MKFVTIVHFGKPPEKHGDLGEFGSMVTIDAADGTYKIWVVGQELLFDKVNRIARAILVRNVLALGVASISGLESALARIGPPTEVFSKHDATSITDFVRVPEERTGTIEHAHFGKDPESISRGRNAGWFMRGDKRLGCLVVGRDGLLRELGEEIVRGVQQPCVAISCAVIDREFGLGEQHVLSALDFARELPHPWDFVEIPDGDFFYAHHSVF